MDQFIVLALFKVFLNQEKILWGFWYFRCDFSTNFIRVYINHYFFCDLFALIDSFESISTEKTQRYLKRDSFFILPTNFLFVSTTQTMSVQKGVEAHHWRRMTALSLLYWRASDINCITKYKQHLRKYFVAYYSVHC